MNNPMTLRNGFFTILKSRDPVLYPTIAALNLFKDTVNQYVFPCFIMTYTGSNPTDMDHNTDFFSHSYEFAVLNKVSSFLSTTNGIIAKKDKEVIEDCFDYCYNILSLVLSGYYYSYSVLELKPVYNVYEDEEIAGFIGTIVLYDK